MNVLMIALLFVACGDKDEDTAEVIPEVTGPEREGVVWTGFNYTWDILSHRIALTRTILEADGSYSLGMIGGDWSTGGTFSDDPLYRVRHQQVTAQGFAVVHGQTELVVGPDGIGSVTATVRDETVLSMSEQVVVLRGFDINTNIEQSAEYPKDYDPALGYTSRGVSFGVSTPTVTDGALEFTVNTEIRWGPQDRSDMNNAIPHAQTAVVVAWTAIGFEGELNRQTVTETVAYPYEPSYSEHPEVSLPLNSGKAPGVLAIRSFDLVIDAQDGSDDGVYLRALGFEAKQDVSGVATEAVAAGSNSSLIEEVGIDFTPTAEVLWLRLWDQDASIEVVSAEGQHDVGETTITTR
ncbi:MAG: hypothetical protein AAFV53_09770 [Myxococcota bacterium]